MLAYSIVLTDVEVSAITACLDAGIPTPKPLDYVPAFRNVADWLQKNVTMLAQGCVHQVIKEEFRKVKITSVLDLNAVERATIVEARKSTNL